MIDLLLSQKEIDTGLKNRMNKLSFEAYAETYGNDEVANIVEQHHLRRDGSSSLSEYPTSKGSNLFLLPIESGTDS